MTGIYGNTPEDKHFETQLDLFLDIMYPDEDENLIEDGDWYEEMKIMEKNNE